MSFLVERVGHITTKNICFLVIKHPFTRVQPNVGGREIFLLVNISVDLVVQTTFQLAALACQLLRVQRNVLITGG